MRRTLLGMGMLAGMLVACSGADPATQQAMATFEQFQDALLTRDMATLEALVTDESRPAIPQIPWQEVASRPRLMVVAASDERGSYRVDVRDPSQPDGWLDAYIVVRENGRMVVDLVATASHYARTYQTAGDSSDFEFVDLSPEDRERARRMALERPRDAR